MEERKGEFCEQGFLPVPLLISASCSSSAANRSSNGRSRLAVVLVRPYWLVTVSSLSIYWCSYAFFFKKKKCGLGQCSKTTVTRTGGRNDRTERPRRRAKGHLRKNTYQKDVGVFACYEQVKRLRFFFFFQVCSSCCVLSPCRSALF